MPFEAASVINSATGNKAPWVEDTRKWIEGVGRPDKAFANSFLIGANSAVERMGLGAIGLISPTAQDFLSTALSPIGLRKCGLSKDCLLLKRDNRPIHSGQELDADSALRG